MTNMYSGINDKSFTRDQINKIGNSIIYFAQTIPDLSKTKILKLLFLLEEASIKTCGNPFFGIDFQLWKHGPVIKDIFIDLSDETPSLLYEFIERDAKNTLSFVAKKKFSDDEFSDNEIKLMDIIADHAKDKPASYLVKQTHGKNSLWRKSALKYGVLESLENELLNSTELPIDFSLLFDNDSYQKEKFEDFQQNKEFIRQLKQ